MKKSYIIGAGGFAKEVHLILKNSSVFLDYEFGGFLDFNPTKETLSIGQIDFPIINENDFLKNKVTPKNVILFLGLGDPKLIQKIEKTFSMYNFPNLIAEDVVIDRSISLGNGNVICTGVKFTVDSIIGSFNLFNLNCTIGHDANIKNYNVINPLVAISGGVEIGNCNLIGTGASVLQYIKIGNNNTIGGNGLLSKDVTDNKIMVGVPCKELIKKK
jgi:sugar O-acyltransferase (sialic acid O-acetyltransferase NeuD family)